jgi:hypothetical protein
MIGLAKSAVARSFNAARLAVALSKRAKLMTGIRVRSFAEATDRWAGRKFAQTPIRYSLVRAGERYHEQVKRTVNANGKAHPVGEAIKRDGIAYVPDLIPAEKIKPVADAFNRCIEHPDHSISLTNGFFVDRGIEAVRGIPNPLRSIPEIAPLMDGPITEIVSTYYGSPFICLLASPYRTYHVPADVAILKDPMSSRWHCDDHRTDLLKVFILLQDTDETMGPLHVLGREDTREAVRQGYRTRNDVAVVIDFVEANAKRLIGKAGTAMFGNTTLCLHRASIPRPGKRRDMLEMRFLPAAEGPGADWMERMDLTANE